MAGLTFWELKPSIYARPSASVLTAASKKVNCRKAAAPTLQPSRPVTEVRICREAAGLTDSVGGPPPFLPGVCPETRPPPARITKNQRFFMASPQLFIAQRKNIVSLGLRLTRFPRHG